MVLRFLYAFLGYCAMPLRHLHYASAFFFKPSSLPKLRARWGRQRVPTQTGALWVHAASMGEVMALAPAVDAWRAREPLFFTCMTASGVATVKRLWGDAVPVTFFPYDLLPVMRRFVRAHKPRALVVMETELWPHAWQACNAQGVPITLINARLSDNSFAVYRRLGFLVRHALSLPVKVAAQSALDAARFRALGVPEARLSVMGNLKYTLKREPARIEQAAQWKKAWGGDRLVWVAGSTHEGEEALVLQAWRQIRLRHPDALLVIVPRHVHRIATCMTLCEEEGMAMQRSSQAQAHPATSVLWVDEMGLLRTYYEAADVAFVGGSLVPVGGHHLLEPLVAGCRVLSGPHLESTRAVRDTLLAWGALGMVQDAASLADAVLRAWAKPDAEARAAWQARCEAMAVDEAALLKLVPAPDAPIEPAPACRLH
jgi:3-deoxy-D-manno-octulosonic-acid transferase